MVKGEAKLQIKERRPSRRVSQGIVVAEGSSTAHLA
jgi:hypothetical protein